MKEMIIMIVVLLMFIGGVTATVILSLNDRTVEGVMTAMTSTISIVLAKVLGKGGKNEQ
jgi:hypothetical protein